MGQFQATLQLAEAELSYTPDDFDRVKQIIHDIAGITMTEANRSLVLSRLAKHVRRLGHARFADYIAFVTSPAGATEQQVMVNALTTNTTRFFREPYHLEMFAEQWLPRLIARAKSGGRVRLWSAGCSSGEEAYSLAAVLLERFPDAGAHDVKILGSDINRDVLAKARRGIYRSSVIETVPPNLRDICFDMNSDDGNMVSISAAAQKLVTFRYMNFVEPWPVHGPFDAILCRNVAIYMDAPTQTRIWEGLISVLDPDGVLFIGHSERLGPEIAARMTMCGRTTFKLAGSA